VYGVSTYFSSVGEGQSVNGYRNLSFSDDDAKSVADLMKAQGWAVTERIKGTTTTDMPSYPTKQQISADISDLASTIGPDSTVFIYFSGHGDLEQKIPYIIPYQGVSDSLHPSINLSNCISPSDMNSMLSALPTKKVIVIFDTCYSGGFVQAGSAIDGTPQNYGPNDGGVTPDLLGLAFSNFGKLLASNASSSTTLSPIFISAAGSLESSYDGTDAMAHGVFTYFLLKAASEGDTNGDGFVTAVEAYTYAVNNVNSNWNLEMQNVPDGSQYEDFYPHISGGDRDLVLFTK
jgi:uncharacterized caspase-like protein